MWSMMNYGSGVASGWGWLMMVFGGLIWLLILIVLVLLIIWLLKQIQK